MSEELLPVPRHSADEASERIAEILHRKEFAPQPKSIGENFIDWFEEQADKLIGPVNSPTVGNTSLVELAVIGLLALVVVVVMRRISLTLRSNAGHRLDTKQDVATHHPAIEWRREAEIHEGSGAWRQAIRCRYRALLSELVERKVLEDFAGRTAGEYQSEATNRLPSLGAPLAEATGMFEAAWYGNEGVGQAQSARIQHLADQVVALTGRSSQSSAQSGADAPSERTT